MKPTKNDSNQSSIKLTVEEAIGLLNDAGFEVERHGDVLFWVDTEPEQSFIDEPTLFRWAKQIKVNLG